METKEIIYKLRTNKGLSQEELAKKVLVTRQAVSRWENGETIPNTETLKLLSKEFNVTINTLLGSEKKLICQCCGMPMDDEIVSYESDGTLNENYCKWCYADGNYMYGKQEDLIEVSVNNLVNTGTKKEDAYKQVKKILPTLDYWKRYEELSDHGQFEAFKQQLIEEINNLNIEGMPKVTKLNSLVGKYVNFKYFLPNGISTQFLNDDKTYLGTQIKIEDVNIYYGIVANAGFIMVATYASDYSNPELVLYKHR